MQVTHKELETMLVRAYKAEPPVSVFVWGPTGVGKSTVVEAVAQAQANNEGRRFVAWNEISRSEKRQLVIDPSEAFIFGDVRLSQYDPSDIKGIPKLESDLDALEWQTPLLFRALEHKEAGGLLFFDEMNLAPPSILASAYQIIHDRQIGESPISKNILILGAGNRSEDRAKVFDMPAPLKNRFGHLTLEVPDLNAWTEWALEHDIDSRIIGYLHFKAEHLHTFKRDQKEPAFATPRAWETCSRMIRGLQGAQNARAVKAIAAMIVGEGVAVGFDAFSRLSEKIDLMDILENPEKIKSIDQVDMKWSVVTGVAEVYRKAKNKKERTNIANGLCGVASHLDDEFGILLLRFVKAARSKFMTDFATLPLWREIAVRYAPYLEA